MQDDSSDEEPEQLQCKLILLGEGAVGKTSIALRFTEDHFATQYKQTIGLDFFMKRIVLPGDIHIAMQVWDIGGQSIGSKMLGNYIYGAQVVLLCYVAMVTPLRIGFDIQVKIFTATWWLEVFVDIYFIADIFINCARPLSPAAPRSPRALRCPAAPRAARCSG